jgi:multiple sugar transport system substrate-binding protein
MKCDPVDLILNCLPQVSGFIRKTCGRLLNQHNVKFRFKIIFKNLKYLFVYLSIILLFCSPEKSNQVTIDFWAMGAEGEYIGRLIPEFEARNPDIKVKVQSIPWSAAHEKLLTAFAGQSTPDVCQLGNTWIPEFQAIGALLALDSSIAHSSIIDKNKYFDGIWKTNVIGKNVYGIPWYVDTRLLFYRKDVLTKAGYQTPPKSWDEWLDLSYKIKNLSSRQQWRYAVFFSLIYNDWAVPVILILCNGGRLLKNNDCYGAFDDPATLEALRFYMKFFEDSLAIRSMTEVSNMYQGFYDGLFSMMITGPWNVSEIRKRYPQLKDRWSTATIPARQNFNSIAGGSSLVLFKNTRHPMAAWKLIEFLSQPEIQLEFFQLTLDLPAVKAAWNTDEIQKDQEMAAFYTQLEHVVPTPKIAEWEQVAVKIQEHLEQVIFGRISLEQAVINLNRDVNRILEKRRWLLSKNLIIGGK